MLFGKLKFATLLFVSSLVLGFYSNAWAHKVISAAYPDGDLIEGEIGFSNGDMAKNLLVEVFDSEDNKLGETTTDEEGFFVFTATKKVDHIFRANLSAGHVATLTVTADELPDDLEGGSVASTPSSQEAVSSEEGVVTQSNLSDTKLVMIDQAGLEKLVSKTSKEVRSLRKELAQYKEERRMQDILGGIGYILGIFGIASFLLGRFKTTKGV
ncbi:cobalt ABC transporter permease [Kiloniella sp. EL199]|uniref:cobalt ABC transporter permease n=1 Tax=Kiloniella sp. EL199 TaxID=2107581 RepID=UPI000EA25635|nr:cobalt ABC transporter permease [Kiloniella sp. EL199]